ncbi:MAG: ABC transporter ATP-binding protein [Candidatus Babeliales bacterium]
MKNKLLSIQNIEKRYNNIQALKGVSLDLFAGEIISLLGINGAGKTTLSSIIATLHPPTYGDILFEGSSIYNDLPNYRSKIGYNPQKPNLNPLLTIKDNLYFAGKYYGMSDQAVNKRLEELNERLGINEYLSYYSTQLSGGWKQRYMIARTLIHSPKLVILDEPTVALDPDIRHQLWYYIKHIRDTGVCVLLTTHYLDEAEVLADRICLLHRGEIKLVDSPQNLIKTFEKGKLEEVFLQLTKEQKD